MQTRPAGTPKRGGLRDLPRFYEAVIQRVREVDALTPVMVDAGYYAAADAFGYWPRPLSDERACCTAITCTNPGWPPAPPTSCASARCATRHRALCQRRAALGCRGRGALSAKAAGLGGAAQASDLAHGGGRVWLPAHLARLRPLHGDVLTALDARQQHWAFYSFREHWDGMDYELGSGRLPQAYWQPARPAATTRWAGARTGLRTHPQAPGCHALKLAENAAMPHRIAPASSRQTSAISARSAATCWPPAGTGCTST